MKLGIFIVFVVFAACGHTIVHKTAPTFKAKPKICPSCANLPRTSTEPIDEDALFPSACPKTTDIATSNTSDILSLASSDFNDLPGWQQDKHGLALNAFLASCAKLAQLAPSDRMGSSPFGGLVKDWLPSCLAAKNVESQKNPKLFFETFFSVYSAQSSHGSKGKFTGYYVQPIRASKTRTGRYQFPVYRRPTNLLAVPLSDFVTDGRSRRIWGKLNKKGDAVESYLTRAEFISQATQKDVLLWLDTPLDALLMEIEGSGKATLPNGETLMVAFAGKNGHRSDNRRSVFRKLKKLLRNHQGSKWTQAELRLYRSIIEKKASMVFFEIESRNGAIGTQDVILTPGRSMAVDRAVIPLSTPLWVDTKVPQTPTDKPKPYRRLLIAQDTGGAILGTIRGDIYVGDSIQSVQIGRRIHSTGKLWLLFPKTLKLPIINSNVSFSE